MLVTSPHLFVELHTRLTVVRYLFNPYFDQSLSQTLLEHLHRWTRPREIIALSLWPRGEEPEVAAAIVGVFYLLPLSPNLLAPLVAAVLALEATHHLYAPVAPRSLDCGVGGGVVGRGFGSGALEALSGGGDGVSLSPLPPPTSRGSSGASPYRDPLLKFLNLHRNDAVSLRTGLGLHMVMLTFHACVMGVNAAHACLMLRVLLRLLLHVSLNLFSRCLCSSKHLCDPSPP